MRVESDCELELFEIECEILRLRSGPSLHAIVYFDSYLINSRLCGLLSVRQCQKILNCSSCHKSRPSVVKNLKGKVYK